MNLKERIARVEALLRENGAPMTSRDLHAAVGEPTHRSDFIKLLRRAEKNGTIVIDKGVAPGSTVGGARLTVRLTGMAAPEEGRFAGEKSKLAERFGYKKHEIDPVLKEWRHQYRSLCTLVRTLGAGGVQQLDHLREAFRKKDELLFATVIANLKVRGAVVVHSESTLSAVPQALQKIWDSEELLCSLAGWSNMPHTQHVTLLLNGSTLIEEVAALNDLLGLVGHTLLKLRTGIGGETVNLLRRWAAMDRSLQQFVTKHDMARGLIRALEVCDENKRQWLLDRVLAENLSLSETMAIATGGEIEPVLPNDMGSEEPEEGYAIVATSEDDPDPPWPVRAAPEASSDSATEQKIDVLLKIMFGVAGDVGALRQRVEWLSKELGWKEKTA